MLEVTSITNGIVIDHIKPGYGFKIFGLLRLNEYEDRVALMMNVDSQLHGKKDIIKIQGDLADLDFNILGLLDDRVTVNYIEGGKIVKKGDVMVPDKIDAYLACTNPRCITKTEREIQPSFVLVDRSERIYACEYCEHLYDTEAVQ